MGGRFRKMDNNSVLKTITDFDFGVGGSNKDFVRVSDVRVQVTAPEINLITWLLLEQEFSKIRRKVLVHKNVFVNQVGGGLGDCLDAAQLPIQLSKGEVRPLNNEAKRYAEALLRAVGVSVPFELLTDDTRDELFRLFSHQSSLLRHEPYRSILDLYEALRRHSKFREEFEVLKILGEGGFGVVHAVQEKSQGENVVVNRYALKRIVISSLDALDCINMVVNESSILKRLHEHPNIVKHYDSWLEVDENNSDTLIFYLQMELCDLPLSRWMEENPDVKLSRKHLRTITIQLLDALEWIHHNNCLHLDINPNNILWADSSYQAVKITDFGLAVSTIACHGDDGTPPYCAPENTLNPKSDLYSLGVTLFEMSNNFSTRSEFMKRIESRDFHTDMQFLDIILPLILRKHPSQRPTIAEVKRMLIDK